MANSLKEVTDKALEERSFFEALVQDYEKALLDAKMDLSNEDKVELKRLLDQGTVPINAKQYLELTSGIKGTSRPPGVWQC